ncbi:putative uncharacterized protein [Vibrio anguillarum]|uniref:Holin n=3 Tax=root TaxID=1 RepID=A0A3G1SVP3_9VIRU|nr:hypothetical protein [Vibrio anguillarum]AXU40238.1 hypothetical protein fNo16_0009 [Vibrio phage fNo16]QYS24677.1 hypothetical protein fNO16VIB134_0009 [Vibrio phage NO16-like VIB134]QYS24769.1 hypothetical protein fNO16NB10_0009 [Vibrio phage NO16-like NB10]QYS24792.1 hypothetical protein fNO1690148_0009 [Vibrio phage NO16-like 9014_8]QYS24815.1 hypothetical protein fNO16117890_0009 [Vibrio phage NO16-like 1178_90]QYS24838.1 hypothetical protein fNO1660191_0009 [Vibrio phage NO16-like 60
MSKYLKLLKQRSTWQGLAVLGLTVGQVLGDAATGGAVSGAIAAVGVIGGAVGLIDDDKANDRATPISN